MFIECVESADANPAAQRAEAFGDCVEEEKFVELGCAVDCAPTFDMLAAGEAPTASAFDRFGPGATTAGARPQGSRCVADSN